MWKRVGTSGKPRYTSLATSLILQPVLFLKRILFYSFSLQLESRQLLAWRQGNQSPGYYTVSWTYVFKQNP